ncbi:MAG: gliding motility-associated C-terminal domain-containing protein, partial [Bacteroidota bacterium]
TTQEVTGLAPGTYTVTVTDANGCEATATVVINEAVSITIVPRVTEPACGGDCTGTITPEVTGGNGELSYLWSDGSTEKDRTGLCAGDYTLTVTDADGNTSTTAATISEPDPVMASISGSTPPACSGDATGSASAAASGGTAPYTFAWSNGATTTDLSDLPAGNYDLTVTDANGCTMEASFMIADPPPVTAAAAADFDPCASDDNTVTLNGSSNVDNVAEWNWTLSDGTILTGQNPTFDLDGAADLTATLSIVTEDGCTATDDPVSIQIEEFNPAELMEMLTPCAGDPVALNPGGDPSLTYTWTPATGLSDANAANPTANVDDMTTFTVTISNGSCEKTDEITVDPSEPLDLVAEGDTSLCETMEVSLSATGSGITSWEWSDDPNFTNVLGTDPNFAVTPENSTTYFVKATNADGCTAVQPVEIVNNALALDINEEASVCSGDDTQLQDQILNLDATQTLTFDWMDPDNIIVSGADTGSPVVNATGSTILNVDVTNEAGCAENVDVSIDVVDIGNVTITEGPIEVVQGTETQLSVTGPPGATYSWSPATGLDDPNSANPTASPDETTEYTVTITTPEGCVATRTVTVTVTPASCEEPFIFFPNAFTPNGDGENDVLFLRGNSITTMYFAIFNRFGEKVFESRSLNSGWDGRFQGEPVCPDVYGYILEATCINGDNFFKQGNVTVLK